MEEIEDAAMTEDFKNVTIKEIKDVFDQGQQVSCCFIYHETLSLRGIYLE